MLISKVIRNYIRLDSEQSLQSYFELSSFSSFFPVSVINRV